MRYRYQNHMYSVHCTCRGNSVWKWLKAWLTQTQYSRKNIQYFFNVCCVTICVKTDYNTPAYTFHTKTCLSSHISQRPLIIDIFVTCVLDLMHCMLLKEFLSSLTM